MTANNCWIKLWYTADQCTSFQLFCVFTVFHNKNLREIKQMDTYDSFTDMS